MERFAEKEERIRYLEQELIQAGIHLEEGQIHQLETYYQMLVEKNKVMNLTAITAFEDVVQKHFIDSMMLLRYADLKAKKVIDVGTGAGFPGIPLKIACPDAEIVLLDSLNKRVQFLKEVMDALHLEKIEAVHGRAEDMAKKAEYREHFDYCVSRAVANLSTLSEYGVPFVKVGGCFISYKSGEMEEESKQAEQAIRILGGEKEKIESFRLPDSDIGRSLIFIRKKKETSKKYPRKAGLPSKEPLK